MVKDSIQFNGYTKFWLDEYHEWIRYGNLFKIGRPNVEYTIAQAKIDLAEDLNMPGLILQEGFINGLFSESYVLLEASKLRESWRRPFKKPTC